MIFSLSKALISLNNFIVNERSFLFLSGSVTLHRLLNSGESVNTVKPTITVPVPLPLHLQPKPLHQLKADAQKLPSQQPNIQANESVKVKKRHHR